jgi:2-keto-4-pentenoate hydratase/2-oxohepta-3-ene-1,7-dioic acid hydratase in catechol pathway
MEAIFMRYRTFERAGNACLAVRIDGLWRDLGERTLVDIIAGGTADKISVSADRPVMDILSVKMLPPIPRPGKVLCVGLNYADHASESPYEGFPKYPPFFPRFASSLIADGDNIVRPLCSHELDFEAELVAVIGKKARHVTVTEALEYVAGYSMFNDASIRNYQFLSVQWTPGKNFDGTGAFGPEFVTADELPTGAKGLLIELFLNGQKMQSANTSSMIFSVADLVSTASEFMTLDPGDLIVTGTPAGVGFARKPPVFMKDGDLVEVKIEGIGTLRNVVRDEASQSAA